MGFEDEPRGDMPPVEGRDGDHELRAEHVASLGELTATIKGELIDGAEEALRNGHVDRIVVRDPSGKTYEHVINRDEIERIDRALWTAGEDMTLERLTEQVVDGIRAAGLDVADPRHLDLEVRLIDRET